MKKLIIFFLAGFMVYSLAACTKSNVKYKDGTYTAFGDAWAYGQENSTVTIKNGKISAVTLRRLDKTGATEVNYEEWTGTPVENQTRPNLKQFRMDMAKRMVDKQTSEVDGFSGASKSSENWKLATRRALQQAEQK